jgi:hypothetical protein
LQQSNAAISHRKMPMRNEKNPIFLPKAVCGSIMLAAIIKNVSKPVKVIDIDNKRFIIYSFRNFTASVRQIS